MNDSKTRQGVRLQDTLVFGMLTGFRLNYTDSAVLRG